jgi:hypothetical protein
VKRSQREESSLRNAAEQAKDRVQMACRTLWTIPHDPIAEIGTVPWDADPAVRVCGERVQHR